MVHYTRQLMAFFLETKYEDIPNNVIHLAKRHFLDCVGSALAEVATSRSNIVQRYFNDIQSEGPCRIIGRGRKVTVENAAFATGILAHTISFDDSGPSHPSVTVVPPLLALGEYYHLSGKDVLTAQVLGYDVFQRLNAVTKDAWEMRNRGWHPTGFFGAVTSAAITSKILKLDLETSLNALGTAATMGGGLSQNIGSMGMGMHAGNASRNGVIAGHLAKEGFVCDHYPLEGRFGLMDALCGPGEYDISVLVKDLGEPFRLLNPGITIKPYPNCWAHQKVYDSVLKLKREHHINAEDVAEILVDLQSYKPTYRYVEPQTDLQARYSLGYGIAVALLDGKIEIEEYDDDRITAPETKAMLAKIKDTPQPEGPEQHRITIVMNDGKKYSDMTRYSKGHPLYNPLSDDELFEKYRTCAGRTLGSEKVEKSLEAIMNLESIDDLSSVIDLLIK